MNAPKPACPICGQPLRPTPVRAYDRLVTGEGPFGVEECAACEYGVTDPQLSNEELAPYYDAVGYYESYYEHTGATAGSLLHGLRSRYRRRSARRRFRQQPYALSGVTPGRVLDVGCGAGELLEDLAARGWETYGIDPGDAATEAASRRGAKVHQGTLADQPWEPESFQLISFNHALEHIVDPVEALRQAQALLAPGGLLAIAVPNWACWQRPYLFRNRWSALDLPRHQQHFSPRALSRLTERLGLEVSAVGTASTAASTAYSVHYLLAGHWTPGWKLWLSYAISIPLLPFVLLGDRFGGGDCCYVVMARAA
jgi:2-polyprenyl-3-methyl-5-hydroxy-6-metoxy-1,4-benzoquinol methylase